MPLHEAPPTLELHTQHFIDGLAGAPPNYTLSPADVRSVLTQAQSVPVGKPNAQIDDMALPMGPTGSVPIQDPHFCPTRTADSGGVRKLRRRLAGSL
jgi:hypothetical protein